MNKVCFVTTISLTLKTFVVDFAKAMHETGDFEIHFICDYDSDFEKSLPAYIHYYPVAMKRGISLDGLKAIRDMYCYFAKEKFDLVQYSTPNASCWAAIASKMARVPCRLYCQWGIAYVGFHGLKRKIFKQIEKLVCNFSTKVEPDSFGNLRFGRDEKLYSAGKSNVIWNGSASGVNLVKFDISQKYIWNAEIRDIYSIPMDAIIFTFVGRITKDKGINELFEAMRMLINERSNAYLLLVGGAENIDSLDPELYNWSVNESHVVYCGYSNTVEKYLASSDIYVLPSYREGFGSAVIEAEAMGVPVIVTNIPGPTDAMRAGKTGVITPKADAHQLYENMLLLCDDESLRERLGGEGAKFARSSFDQIELFERMIMDRREMISS